MNRQSNTASTKGPATCSAGVASQHDPFRALGLVIGDMPEWFFRALA
jgi:hypothetical protein